MASPFSYQMPSWHEDAPFPVEGNIVNNMASAPWTSGTQLPLLAMYMAQRASGQRGYANELDSQHQFAAQALAQHNAHETQANALKLMEMKNPGALAYAAGNPNLSPLTAGSDPGATGAFADQANRMYSSEISANMGKAIQGMAVGGQGPPMDATSAITGLPIQPATTDRERTEAMRVAAGGGKGGSGGEKWKMTYGSDNQPTGFERSGKGPMPATLLPPAPTKRSTRTDTP